MENPIEEAKEKVDEAIENLERVETEVKIDNAEATAQTAIDIALNASSESQNAIDGIRDELIEHEENDEWQRKQIHALMIRMDSLQGELLTLNQSLQNLAPKEPAAEIQPEPEAKIETLSPETMTETSNETKTEALKENADESPEPLLQTVLNPQRKIRLV